MVPRVVDLCSSGTLQGLLSGSVSQTFLCNDVGHGGAVVMLVI